MNEKQQQAQFERQQAMLAKEIKFIERFKARASHAAQVQSRVKKLDKIERVEPPKRRQTVSFDFQPAPRSGEDVVNLKNVHKAMAAAPSMKGWTSGPPQGALVRHGHQRRRQVDAAEAGDRLHRARQRHVASAAASRWAISPSTPWTCWMASARLRALEDSFPQAGPGPLRALAGCFGFSGDDVEKRCRVLSGGEKARLVMAKMLFDPPNFLVLDEPTNHLDIATKEMLIKALSQYEGTMLFVSHDRHFLGAVEPRAGTDAGRHPQYGGGYTEYVERTGQEAPGLRSCRPNISRHARPISRR
jgi:ATPase subunit of ABC transporter with duplicated ATPase domains